MKPTFKFLTVSVLVLIGLSLNAYSSYAYGGHHGRGGEIRRIGWILKKGGQPVTDEQKEQIRGIMKANWTTMKPTLESLRETRKTMRDSILAGTATDESIKTQVNAIVPYLTTLAENRAQIFKQIVTSVLTAEQRTILQNFKTQKTQ